MDLGRVICETDPRKAEARDAQMRKTMAEGAGTTIRQDLFPPITSGPLCLDSDAAGAGKPAPQPNVMTKDGWQPLDKVTGYHFSLLILPGTRIPDTDQYPGLDVHVIGTGKDAMLEEHDVFAVWMNAHNARAILVRPDRMVMAAFADPDRIAPALLSLKPLLWAHA